MAGYSDNREQNMEIKYLRKVLSEVDRDVQVPASIRGDALRQKLDNIKPGTYWPEMMRNLLRRDGKPLKWQAGLAYAASLAFVVALGYLAVSHNNQPQLINGKMQVAIADTVQDEGTPGTPEQAEPFEAEAFQLDEAVPEETPPDINTTNDGESVGSHPPAVRTEIVEEPGGIGGGGEAKLMAAVDGYTYHWRINDQNDPDKKDYPVTIEVVDATAEQLVAQIDLGDITSVEAGYVDGNHLAVIGPGPDGLTLCTYNISDRTNPVEMAVESQPGSYLASSLFQGRIYLATRYEGSLPDTTEEALPDSEAAAYCILSALDLTTARSATKAFKGADGVVSLQDGSAVIAYTASTEEGEETREARIAMGTAAILLESAQ